MEKSGMFTLFYYISSLSWIRANIWKCSENVKKWFHLSSIVTVVARQPTINRHPLQLKMPPATKRGFIKRFHHLQFSSDFRSLICFHCFLFVLIFSSLFFRWLWPRWMFSFIALPWTKKNKSNSLNTQYHIWAPCAMCFHYSTVDESIWFTCKPNTH